MDKVCSTFLMLLPEKAQGHRDFTPLVSEVKLPISRDIICMPYDFDKNLKQVATTHAKIEISHRFMISSSLIMFS